MGALLARYEWALIEVLVIGLAVFELISVNRSIRRDKIGQAKPPSEPPSGSL